MDQIQATATIPHVVQVFQPSTSTPKTDNQIVHISHPSLQTAEGEITYQQTIPTESLAGTQHDMQEQIVMSCNQNVQNMTPGQSQAPSAELPRPVEFGAHVMLPQVPFFKQNVIVDQQHYYGNYETVMIRDRKFIIAKIETPEPQADSEKQIESKQEKPESDKQTEKERNRNLMPNPSAWACNVRKTKHQRGEAYINRRGKYVPEKQIRNTKNCLTYCRFKCNERISDMDREHIFKAFYSLNANEKKHFLLNTTERNLSSQKLNAQQKRRYNFKYFFLVRGIRYMVCKNFYLGTLSISQKPVYNVHMGKSEMNIPKPDGRGLSKNSTHPVPQDVKDRVRNHIMSFKTVDSKVVEQFSRKKQYLSSCMNMKQMYTMYSGECSRDHVEPVKESMYRKIFKQEFNLHFKKTKGEQLCAKCKEPIKNSEK